MPAKPTDPLDYIEGYTYQAYYSEVEAVGNFIRGKSPEDVIFALFIDNRGDIFPATQLQANLKPDGIHTDREESGPLCQPLKVALIQKKHASRNELSFDAAKQLARAYAAGSDDRVKNINRYSTRHPRYGQE